MKTEWTMCLAVLSTGHAPSRGAIVSLCDRSLSAVDHRWGLTFIYIDVDEDWEDDEAWVAPIAAWMRENYPGENWVRFDPDGDMVPELPSYEW
jgi:hypothetical protein